MHPVLEVTLRRPRDRLRLARTIDDRGLHRHHTLLSVDVDPVAVDLARCRAFRRRAGRRGCLTPRPFPDVMDDVRVLRMEAEWDGPLHDGRLLAVRLSPVEAVGLEAVGPSDVLPVQTDWSA